MRLPGTGRDRWIALFFLLLGAGSGAAVYAKATARPVLVVAPGFLQHQGNASPKVHRVSINEQICCKVETHLLVVGPSASSSMILVSDPTSIDVAVPDVSIGMFGQYTILLLIDQRPVASATLTASELLSTDALNVEYDEFKGLAQISTVPDISIATGHAGRRQ